MGQTLEKVRIDLPLFQRHNVFFSWEPVEKAVWTEGYQDNSSVQNSLLTGLQISETVSLENHSFNLLASSNSQMYLKGTNF